MGLLLSPHIEVLLVGWTMQLAMGTAFWIVPRFTGENKYGRVGLAWAAFALINAGVITVVVSFLLTNYLPALTLLGRLLEGAAVIVFVVYIWPRVKPFAQ